MKKGIFKQLISVILVTALLFSNGNILPNQVKDVEASTSTIPELLDYYYNGKNASIMWNYVDGAESYNIYYAESRYGDYEKINSVEVTTNEYTYDKDGCFRVAAVINGVETELSDAISAELELFGENIYIFDEDDNPDEVQNVIYDIYDQQEDNQFGTERYALLFKPGKYNTQVDVGYYTQVAGLGLKPTDTTLEPAEDSQGNLTGGLECGAYWWPMVNGHIGYNATLNFWRSAENLQVNNDVMWAVSQAVSLRRMQINGNLTLHHWGGWSSGGFLADSIITGATESGSQQQWFTRNTNWGNWKGQNWNMVFVGLEEGDAPKGQWPEDAFTVVDETPVVREKPFLTIDENDNYSVFVPELRTNSKGVSWSDSVDGKNIELDKFYIAKPDVDSADSINEALAQGKHLLLTPGIYKIDKPIKVLNANTVVLGLGLATLESTNGNCCLEIADVDGVKVCGILVDAGEKSSKVLLKVGEEGSNKDHSANPTSLSDVYIRIGGEHVGRAETSMIINSNNVIGDNFWIWRADHGEGAKWDTNTTKNGIVVNGDDVTVFALMVEHYHEYQTVWNGNGGEVYFYQSEIPYDVPNQESWVSHDGNVNGFASYKVADNVTSHKLYGAGIYSYHRDAEVELFSAIEVPDVTNVRVEHACSVMLAGHPGISHVVNNAGGSVSIAGDRQTITVYEDNVEAPTVTPSTGMYNNAKDVGITTSTEGAKIYYTTDGTEPSADNGTLYTKPFGLTPGRHVIKAIAIKPGKTDSYVTTEIITIGNALNGKKATASSKSDSAGSAIDGSMATRWQAEAEDPQWLQVDLGKEYALTSFYITWQTAAGKAYTIDVSDDGKTWNTIYTVTDGEKGHTISDVIEETKARYVRVYITERATQYGASIFEFQVYGLPTIEIEVPDAPMNVKGNLVSENSFKITWDEVKEADSYNIYRASGANGGYLKINSEPIVATEYIDENLSKEKHLYRVTALNSSGESFKSSFVGVNLKEEEKETEVESTDVDDAYIRDINRATVLFINEDGYGYTGKAIEPFFIALYTGKELKPDKDITIKYANNLYPGVASITITGIGKYGGEKTIEFKIVESGIPVVKPLETTTTPEITSKEEVTTTSKIVKPKRVKKLKVKKVKSKFAIIKWKISNKKENVKGYQIVYSTNKKIKKQVKRKTVTYKKFKKNKRLFKLKKLKAGKKYYVKVRAFKKVNGKKIYGKFSKVKKFKVK